MHDGVTTLESGWLWAVPALQCTQGRDVCSACGAFQHGNGDAVKGIAGSYLVLLASLDTLHNLFPGKAQLDHLIHHLVVNEGGSGHGVGLDNRQVPWQMLTEPGVLPAMCMCYHWAS